MQVYARRVKGRGGSGVDAKVNKGEDGDREETSIVSSSRDILA